MITRAMVAAILLPKFESNRSRSEAKIRTGFEQPAGLLRHWHAYQVHIVQQRSVESMVLTSLRGSTFTAILLSGGATLQAVQNLSLIHI